MSRRTKWFQLIGRRGTSSGRATTKRAGRALGFEHCEPRIALSVNAAGDALHFTTNSFVSEGGLIGFDVGPTGAGSSDSLLSNGSGIVRNTVDGGDLMVAGSQPRTSVADFNHIISVGELFSDQSKVQQIAAPVGGVLQPEGGQIAIIDAPHGEMAALAHAESGMADVRTSRPLLDSSTAGPGVGQGPTREVEGLRGRAIVFEVAHAKMDASGHRAGAERDVSDTELAVDEAVAALTADRVDAAHQSPATPANYARDSSPPDSSGAPRSSQIADSASAAPRQIGQATARVVALRSSRDAQPSRDADAEAMLATRDAALEHWASAAAAPLAEKESGQELGALRSRKVLALALVLTVGAGPASRLFRRRAPAEAGHEQPSQRRRALDLV